jgi:hypothetical protein
LYTLFSITLWVFLFLDYPMKIVKHISRGNYGWVTFYTLFLVLVLYLVFKDIKNAVSKIPFLGINDTGLMTRKFGFIPWSEIIDVKIKKNGCSIFVENSDKYIEKISGFRLKLSQIHDKHFGTPIHIYFYRTKFNIEQCDALIQSHINQNIVNISLNTHD